MNFLLISAMILLAASFLALARAAKNAPEGREDATGFMFGDEPQMVSVRRRLLRRPDSTPAIPETGAPHLAA
ncbi:MAG TPA: hypothetical protein VGM73_10585 [Candidatus Didemnitutus sp.]|jgi:hypothetical protein